jgi:hypothetical protein
MRIWRDNLWPVMHLKRIAPTGSALNKARQLNLPTTDVCQWLYSGSA